MDSILHLDDSEPIRIVSDLHLGHIRSTIDDASQLDFLLDGIKHLIVAGDMSEDRPGLYCTAGHRQRDKFIAMCAARGVTLHELAGNHDPSDRPSMALINDGLISVHHGHTLYKVVAPWGWEYINHGDLCDDLVKSRPQADTDLEARFTLARDMSNLIFPIYEIPVGHHGDEQPKRRSFLVKVLHILWPPVRPWRILSAWAHRFSLADSFASRFTPQARLVIFGHFHRRGIARRHGRLYINTGAVFRHATSYAVDLYRGQLSVRSYTPAGFDSTPVRRFDTSTLAEF